MSEGGGALFCMLTAINMFIFDYVLSYFGSSRVFNPSDQSHVWALQQLKQVIFIFVLYLFRRAHHYSQL